MVRRRRAVLALLVACSLILLTAYYGESAGGGLHAVQRGFVEVVSPIQAGASRALKPVRDLFGWFDDTVHAKKDRDKLSKQVAQWRAAGVANAHDKRKPAQLEKLTRLDPENGPHQKQALTPPGIRRSPPGWDSTGALDK